MRLRVWTLGFLTGMVIAFAIAATGIAAHARWKHEPGTLAAPLLHEARFLRAKTDGARGGRCLGELRRQWVPVYRTPPGMRLFTVRVERRRLATARASSSRCIPADPVGVIRYVFGPYGQADAAVSVSRCETGGTFSIYAANGQYLGLFQMGRGERARWGFGWTALAQARAALSMWRDTGWGRWQCIPGGGLRW